MLSTDDAILRARRDLALSTFVRRLLLIIMLIVALVGPMLQGGWVSGGLLVGLLIFWMSLQARSLRLSQETAHSPMLIAAGAYQEAEEQIERSLRGFSIAQNVKLMGLHYLSLLRHAQKRFDEAVLVCHALLERRGTIESIERSTRLVLADSLLELNDLRGAHAAILGLYSHRLSLGEAMQLLVIELEYSARVGGWQEMLNNAASKIDLAEAMPGEAAARAQAFLALAAKMSGLTEMSLWLRRRAELLMDPSELIGAKPFLRELWETSEFTPSPGNPGEDTFPSE